MRYRITTFQIMLLEWIAKKIVIQSDQHKSNIIRYYKILTDAARDQFSEDNKITLDDFLTECHQKSLEIKEER